MVGDAIRDVFGSVVGKSAVSCVGVGAMPLDASLRLYIGFSATTPYSSHLRTPCEIDSRYPKKQWERSDSLQRERVLNDFISRELCVFEAKKLSFEAKKTRA